jgi:hypothetical protein
MDPLGRPLGEAAEVSRRGVRHLVMASIGPPPPPVEVSRGGVPPWRCQTPRNGDLVVDTSALTSLVVASSVGTAGASSIFRDTPVYPLARFASLSEISRTRLVG